MKSKSNSQNFEVKKNDSEEASIRIIFIMTFSPKYEYTTKDTFKTIHSWENDKGEFMGVWIEDHAHKFGFNLLKYHPFVNFEVWRPDYRAERVYEHTFENGLVHRSFPAIRVKVSRGLYKRSMEYAPVMESYLDAIIRENKMPTLLVVPAANTAFSEIFFKKYPDKIPILGYTWISNNTLFKQFARTWNPIKRIHHIMYVHQHEKHMKRVKKLSVYHWGRIEELKNQYGCKVWFNPLGMEVGEWLPDNMSKRDVRKTLSLGNERIFLFTGRLVSEYQIDKVLDIVGKLREYKFLCIFTSIGPKEYTSMLEQKIRDLKIEDHVLFTGYLETDIFKKYFVACDVFCSTCTQQAGPFATLTAMLMEKPVMATDTGLAAELLKMNECGLLFPPTDYEAWEKAFKSVIKSDTIDIKVIDRNKVVEVLDIEIRINAWLSMFKEVIKNFNNKI